MRNNSWTADKLAYELFRLYWMVDSLQSCKEVDDIKGTITDAIVSNDKWQRETAFRKAITLMLPSKDEAVKREMENSIPRIKDTLDGSAA